MKILLIQPKMNKRPMDTDLKTKMSPSLELYRNYLLRPENVGFSTFYRPLIPISIQLYWRC